MGIHVTRLTDEHTDALARVWQDATGSRREAVGLEALAGAAPALGRPGSFGVGMFEGSCLLSGAVAMPARADDARSDHNVAGLAHISSVVTSPGRWGEGLATSTLTAVMSQARRRGYARCQLWTHATNARAHRLYEGAGFVLSGRTSVDDGEETIVHYLRELPAPPHVTRSAARVVCLDGSDRMLLMHWRDPVDGHQLWEPPGGGVEPGEGPRDAVLREWLEETGLPRPELVGESTTVARDVFWAGGRLVGEETFFLGRLPASRPPEPAGFTRIEVESYLGHAWVGRAELADLEAAGDPVEPDVLPVLDRLRA